MFTADNFLSIEDAAKALVANHRKFDSFGWHDAPEDKDNWCIIYTHNRDSSLMQQSNAEEIAKSLEVPAYENDIRPEHHGHWACGWIDGYAVRVYAPDGSITPAFQQCWKIAKRLSNYPSLNDERLSELELEAAFRAIEQEGMRSVKDSVKPEDDWIDKVYNWLSDNDPSALEDTDGNGPYPPAAAICEALKALDMLEE